MRKITDIYSEYKIMPNLATHQFRVAAVALQVCTSFFDSLDTESVIKACLLHDMGNIVKFRLRDFPALAGDVDIVYWENIQKEFQQKYGTDDHHATLGIVDEIGISSSVRNIIDAVGFPNWCVTYQQGLWEYKIATYADSRVGPFGVLSLEDRLADGKERYKDASTNHTTDTERDSLYTCVHMIEKEIFSHSNITPSDITDSSIAETIEVLKNFEL